MMNHHLLDSINLLSRGCDMFTESLRNGPIGPDGKRVGVQPDEDRCKSLIEGLLDMCTSLVPVIGYDKSAALAKDAFKQGKTVRRLAHETVVGQKDVSGKLITKEQINEYLNPWSMTLPGGEGAAGG